MIVKASSSVPPTLRFGVFELDPKAGELRKKGMKIRLQGQPVDILVMLLQRPGETVTREELQENLWPADTFVDFEQGLNNAMKRLRAALDDDAESPHFIETLPRRGYRFIAPVESTGIGKLQVEAPNDGVPKHAPKWSRTLRLAILFGGVRSAARSGLLPLQAAQSFRAAEAAHSDPRHVRRRPADRCYLVARRPLHRLQFRSWRKIRHLGAASQRWRSYPSNQRDQVTTGNLTGHPTENILPIVPRRAMEASISCLRWAERDWNVRFRRLDIFHAGPRIVPKYCFRRILRRLITSISSTWLLSMEARRTQVLAEFLAQHKLWPAAAVWHPDGKRVSVWVSSLAGDRGQDTQLGRCAKPQHLDGANIRGRSHQNGDRLCDQERTRRISQWKRNWGTPRRVFLFLVTFGQGPVFRVRLQRVRLTFGRWPSNRRHCGLPR